MKKKILVILSIGIFLLTSFNTVSAVEKGEIENKILKTEPEVVSKLNQGVHVWYQWYNPTYCLRGEWCIFPFGISESHWNLIQYCFNFGDGSGWSRWSFWTDIYLYKGGVDLAHRYMKTGEYELKFVVRNTNYNYASATVTVIVTPNKSLEKDLGFLSNELKIFLWNQPNLFPILRHLLRL